MSSPEIKKPPLQAPPSEQKHDVLPTLFGDGYGLYEVRKGSFVVSFILNTAVIALLIWAGKLDCVSCSADQAGSGRISGHQLPTSCRQPRMFPVVAVVAARTT